MRGVGKHRQRAQEHQLFRQIREIEIRAVGCFIDLNRLPWNYRIYINKDPPDKQQGEIEHAYAFIALVLPQMRKYCKRSDHRHQMQEQNNVAQERFGNILTL